MNILFVQSKKMYYLYAVRREDRLHSEKIKINFVFSLICRIFVSAKKTLIYHEHYRTISQLREV